MFIPLPILLAAQAAAPQLTPQPVAPPPVVRPVDPATAPLSPGSWSYSAIPGGSHARFVDSTGTARLVLQCMKATRLVSISQTSTTPAASLSVWTSSGTRPLAARFEPNGFRVTADIQAHDPLLDAIAFSRGRFSVSLPGVAPVVVPAWAEPARAIEDCRS